MSGIYAFSITMRPLTFNMLQILRLLPLLLFLISSTFTHAENSQQIAELEASLAKKQELKQQAVELEDKITAQIKEQEDIQKELMLTLKQLAFEKKKLSMVSSEDAANKKALEKVEFEIKRTEFKLNKSKELVAELNKERKKARKQKRIISGQINLLEEDIAQLKGGSADVASASQPTIDTAAQEQAAAEAARIKAEQQAQAKRDEEKRKAAEAEKKRQAELAEKKRQEEAARQAQLEKERQEREKREQEERLAAEQAEKEKQRQAEAQAAADAEAAANAQAEEQARKDKEAELAATIAAEEEAKKQAELAQQAEIESQLEQQRILKEEQERQRQEQLAREKAEAAKREQERLAREEAERQAQQAAQAPAEPTVQSSVQERLIATTASLPPAESALTLAMAIALDSNGSQPRLGHMANISLANPIGSEPTNIGKMQHLGNNQYIMEMRVNQGLQQFRMGGYEFTRNIPSHFDGVRCLLLLDARDDNNPVFQLVVAGG